MENSSFYPVASFDRYIEAHLLLNRLEEEGITCFLKDEFTVTIDPILTNAVGGIKVMVLQDDMAEAETLLKQWKEDAEKNAACPNCGNGPLELVSSGEKPANLLSGILGVFLGSFAIAVKKEYRCFSCNAVFNELPEKIFPGH